MNKLIRRPALRYFGGKYRLAPWIMSHFPDHVAYIEPFGGAMGIMLRKDPAPIEIYNDIDGSVVNFFKTLRDQPDQLIRAIQLTPFSREEQMLAYTDGENDTDLERARKLYIRCWQSHGGGRTQWRTGWRYDINVKRGKPHVGEWCQTDHLWAIVERLKMIGIENDDALKVIDRYDTPETLFYLDPPYLSSTRSTRWAKKAYTFELQDEYHHQLAEKLHKIKGMAILSGKPSPLYNELYEGWFHTQKTVPTDFQSTTLEVLWLSPRTISNTKQIRMKF